MGVSMETEYLHNVHSIMNCIMCFLRQGLVYSGMNVKKMISTCKWAQNLKHTFITLQPFLKFNQQ